MPKKNSLKIKFVGGKKREDAPEFLTDGGIRIDLPKDQSKPFAHARAEQILKVAPELYKRILPRKRKAWIPAESGKFVSAKTAADNPATTVSDRF